MPRVQRAEATQVPVELRFLFQEELEKQVVEWGFLWGKKGGFPSDHGVKYMTLSSIFTSIILTVCPWICYVVWVKL